MLLSWGVVGVFFGEGECFLKGVVEGEGEGERERTRARVKAERGIAMHYLTA